MIHWVTNGKRPRRPRAHPARMAQERRIAEVERDLRRHGIRLTGSRSSRTAFARAVVGPDVETVARVIESLWSGTPRLDRPVHVALDGLCAAAGVDGFMLVRVLRALEERYMLLEVLELRADGALLKLAPLPRELVAA